MRSLAQTLSLICPKVSKELDTIHEDPVNALAEETMLKDSLCWSFTNHLLLNMDMVADPRQVVLTFRLSASNHSCCLTTISQFALPDHVPCEDASFEAQ